MKECYKMSDTDTEGKWYGGLVLAVSDEIFLIAFEVSMTAT